jgi:hypothetical protein
MTAKMFPAKAALVIGQHGGHAGGQGGFHVGLCWHGVIKAESPISVKGYSRMAGLQRFGGVGWLRVEG